jgi:predicted phosphodiesterase
MRLLNPGSPTDRRRQPHHSYLTATVADGALTGVTLHRL